MRRNFGCEALRGFASVGFDRRVPPWRFDGLGFRRFGRDSVGIEFVTAAIPKVSGKMMSCPAPMTSILAMAKRKRPNATTVS